MKKLSVTLLPAVVVFLTLVSALLLWWFGRGAPIGEVAQILFAPFTLDISRGVGDFAAMLFRWITGATFLAIVLSLILVRRVEGNVAKSALNVGGILVTIVHFTIVGLGYFSTGLH